MRRRLRHTGGEPLSGKLGLLTRVLGAVAYLLLAGNVSAGDGRVELNQGAITAAGGFPFRILSAGSYVLTGDLTAPAGATAIQIGANDVTLDLNGFAIRGPHVCGSGGCSAGSTIGIEALPLVSELARDTTVRNGVVAGFGANCLDLGAGASVEGLIVKRCGGSGVRAAEHARVAANRVSDCGAWGLSFLAAASYGDNVVSSVNRLGGSGFIAGGTSSGGNVCDVGRCLRERRRYYLTISAFQGNHGANDCASGFHMASIFELFDLSSLAYDTALGRLSNDSGSGPPSGISRGWARNGGNASDSCSAALVPWTSATSGADGTLASLDLGLSGSVLDGRPNWFIEISPCNLSYPVWCVED